MKTKLICLVAVLTLSVINLASCGASPSTPAAAAPLLPQGFMSAQVPNVALDGFVYIDQGTPFTFSPPNSSDQRPQVTVNSALVWLGPDVNTAGGEANFASPADAQAVNTDIGSGGVPVWSLVNGSTLYSVVKSPSTWTSSLETAITNQQFVSITASAPNLANMFTYFPSNPGLTPFAAGFIDLTTGPINSISNLVSSPITGYISDLQMAQISNLSFIAYSGKPLTLPATTLGPTDITSLQLGVLAVGVSGYPSAVISTLFGSEITGAGFTSYTASGVNIYQYQAGTITILVASKGNVIYVSLAQSKDLAQTLLLSCF